MALNSHRSIISIRGSDTLEDEQLKYINWINSLNIIAEEITEIGANLIDGIILLKIVHKIFPGTIDWSLVDTKNTHNKFKQLQNCNY